MFSLDAESSEWNLEVCTCGGQFVPFDPTVAVKVIGIDDDAPDARFTREGQLQEPAVKIEAAREGSLLCFKSLGKRICTKL